MQLGVRSIFNSVFEEKIVSSSANSSAKRKSRNEFLKNKQHELIVARYYYHIKLQNKNYPSALEVLEEEIFLRQRTIVNILMIESNRIILKELQQRKPKADFFKKKFPQFVWK